MSRTIDLFIDSDQALGQVAQHIAELAEVVAEPSPDGCRYVLWQGAMSAHLSEHDFVDDDDLPLGDYRYVVSAVVRSPGGIDDSTELSYLRAINRQLRQEGVWPSLLVIDLERPDDGDASR